MKNKIWFIVMMLVFIFALLATLMLPLTFFFESLRFITLETLCGIWVVSIFLVFIVGSIEGAKSESTYYESTSSSSSSYDDWGDDD